MGSETARTRPTPSSLPEPEPREELDPEGDEDQDSVANGVDLCPYEPETYQGIDDEDGCSDMQGSRDFDCDFVLDLVSLRGVDFARGEVEIDADDEKAVQELIEFMFIERDLVITIAGTSDGQASKRDAQRLSEQRAESVRAYMIKRGIDGDRLTTRGGGAGARAGSRGRGVEIWSFGHPHCPDLADGGASARAPIP